MLDQAAVCNHHWDHHAGQLHFVQTIPYFLFIWWKLLPWLNPNHTDSMRNWNPQRKWQLLRWTATTAGNVTNRRGFAAILCLKDRNTCFCLQQQRKHLLMEIAQTSHSSRNWNLDQCLGSCNTSLIHCLRMRSVCRTCNVLSDMWTLFYC